jgi:hypothetical protein
MAGRRQGLLGYNDNPTIDSGTMCRNESCSPRPMDSQRVTRVTFTDDEVDVVNPYPDVIYRLRDEDGSYPEGLAGYGRGKSKYRMHQNFAREVRDALIKVGKEWARRHPKGPRLVLGEGTIFGGGPHWSGSFHRGAGHVSHQTGYDVDILVARKDGQEGRVLNPITRALEFVSVGHPLYSLELTKEMIKVISDYSPVKVEMVLFADEGVKSAIPKEFLQEKNHKKHFHVRFKSEPRREQIKIGPKKDPWGVPRTLKYGE